MKDTLDMKVTISAVATPELYRTMIGVSNPRQRAALLKRLADDYLKGVVSQPQSRVAPLEPSSFDLQQLPTKIPSISVPAKERYEAAKEAIATTKSSSAVVTLEDDAHYDFLENNLTGFG
jgi:hypothetical protein